MIDNNIVCIVEIDYFLLRQWFLFICCAWNIHPAIFPNAVIISILQFIELKLNFTEPIYRIVLLRCLMLFVSIL